MAEEATTTEEEVAPTEEETTEAPAEAKPEIDFKAHSRKHENRAKAEKARADKAEAELQKLRDADKSDQQKAIDEAREAGKAEALTAGDKERRHDRLEVAVTRIAAKGVTIGSGDKAKQVRFADTEDALLNVERGIKAGDIDADDIFDSEGKVHTDALTTALQDLLARKPHLGADGTARTSGDADAGKGAAATGPSADPEEHFQRIKRK